MDMARISPKVSFIIPVYNVDKYLTKCVNSVRCQTESNIEIILVDDGSTDNSGKICDIFSKKDSRILTIHQKNQGVSVARNTGLDNATGEWVTFVDSDDWIDKQLCENTVSYAEKMSADIVMFSYWTVCDNKKKKSKLIDLFQGNITDEKELILKKTISQYYGGNVMNNGVSAGTTWGKLIRRDIIENNNLRFKEGITRAQDTVFWLYGFNCCKKICLLDENLYYYRLNDGNVTSGNKYLPECEKPFSMLLNEYQAFLSINGYDKYSDFRDAFNIRAVNVILWHMKHKYLHKNYKVTIKQRINDIKKLLKQNPYKESVKNVKLKYLPKSLTLLVLCARCHITAFYCILQSCVYKTANYRS